MLLHQPAIAAGAHQIGAHLRFDSGLRAYTRECTILAIAAMLECEFEWSAHVPAAAAAGVDDYTIKAIRDRRFEELSGEAFLAVEIARSLTEDHAISPDAFEHAAQIWSVAELVDLVSLVGYYTFVSIVLSGFEVTSPEP